MIRAPVPDLAPGERRLDGAVGHYLARVLRLAAGDAFVAFDPSNGREADALALTAEHDTIVARFGELRPGSRRADRELTWLQGLAKGDKCDAVVRDATELGATRVGIVATRRSVVRLDEARGAGRRARWTRIAEQAARQCGRSDPPAIDEPCAWAVGLARVGAAAARFCLWEEATEPLAPLLFDALSREAPLAFACGPEGGLDEGEVAEARTLGFRAVSLGPTALRTETVAAAVLGAVRVWGGLWAATRA